MEINKDVEEVLLSEEQIVNKCKELGKKISEDYEGKRPILIGLLKGSVPFLAELIKHITIEIEIDFIRVSSYNGAYSSGNVQILSDVSIDIKGRDIIFVEDIIDTGLTLSEVVKKFRTREVSSLELVTLVDKPEGRKVEGVIAKYSGFNIPNKFVIGFGLDYNEVYRNLPYIGVLKRSVYENK